MPSPTRSPLVVRSVLLALAATCAMLLGPPSALAVAPVPSFTVGADEVHVGQAVTFSSTSTDADGDALTVSWDFDGDGAADATGPSVSWTFGSAGTKSVTVSVSDAAGESASVSQALAVLDPPPPPAPPPPAPAPPSLENAAPSASFTVSVETPVVGQSVTLTSTSSDSDGTIARYDWDLDGDGLYDDATGPSVSRSFSRTRTIGLRVQDDGGAAATATRRLVVNQPPSASFTVAPAVVIAGQPVAFASTSRDRDGSVARLEWSLDGDDVFDDGSATSLTRRYTAIGPVVTRLRATDDQGAQTVATVIVNVVADRPPVASFSFSPAVPRAGEPVTFTSHSSDPDGGISALAWDLDGDGAFDDAAGASVTLTYRTNGDFVVALRATDDNGASSIAFQTVAVRGSVSLHDAPADTQPGSAPNSTPLSSSPKPGTSSRIPSASPSAARLLLSPFPVVRIRGRALGPRVTVNLLSIRAGAGAKVVVRCRGKGCPRKSATARAVSAKRPVRLRSLEKVYSPGAVLEVSVTKPGRIGKFVRFRIRNGAAPARTDGCLSARRAKAVKCPA